MVINIRCKGLIGGIFSLAGASLADTGSMMGSEGYVPMMGYGYGGGMMFGAMLLWFTIAVAVFSVIFWMAYKLIVVDTQKGGKRK